MLSRCTVFEFKSVEPSDVIPAVIKGFKFLEEELGGKITFEDDVPEHIAVASGGDVRKALNFTELSVLAAKPDKNGERNITLEQIGSLTAKNTFRYDKFGDEHYDILSAFQKTKRGSDPDAALHYLARLLEAGDMPSAIRRLLVCACEDVGLAYPNIIPIVKSACDIALQVGMPEARIPLGDAVVLVATSPKSNTAHLALDEALEDVRSGNYGRIPRTLQNKHFVGEDNAIPGQFYKYPHDYPNRWVNQQYLPDTIKDKKYYTFGENKTESASREYWKKIKGE